MVEELFSAMQNRNIEEAYYDFALEQINNSFIRDMYMGSIAEAFEGYEQEPSEIMQEADQLDDFMMEGISTEEMVDERKVPNFKPGTTLQQAHKQGKREGSIQGFAAGQKRGLLQGAAGATAIGGALAVRNMDESANMVDEFMSDGITTEDLINETQYYGDTFNDGVKYGRTRGMAKGALLGAIGATALTGAKYEYDKYKQKKSNTKESYEYNDDFMMEGQGCEGCCTDPVIVKAIDLLPESDPRDAGTFFSRTNAVSAECNAACQEQFDLIDAIIPDTIITL